MMWGYQQRNITGAPQFAGSMDVIWDLSGITGHWRVPDSGRTAKFSSVDFSGWLCVWWWTHFRVMGGLSSRKIRWELANFMMQPEAMGMNPSSAWDFASDFGSGPQLPDVARYAPCTIWMTACSKNLWCSSTATLQPPRPIDGPDMICWRYTLHLTASMIFTHDIQPWWISSI